MHPPDPTATAAGGTLLRLEGRDALEVLHRISTQFLTDLAPGNARATLFCEFRGRLLHRAVVAVTSDGAVWLLRDDAPGGSLSAHLERHVFREDVRLSDHGAGRFVRAVPGGVALAHGTLREADGVPIVVQGEGGGALEVDVEPAIEPDEDAARARITAGRPRHGHEIAEAFTPFEVGLAHEVHLQKGCFTGQEALMRLITYRSVRRRLARVAGDGEAPVVPREVTSEGRNVGVLTSTVADGTGWVGLAVLAHAACEPGVAVAVAGGGAIERVEPFPLTRPLGLA